MNKLDAMKTFVEVVKQGSFTKAADSLSTSPQLVSKYVSYLEAQLNTRLLNRTTRRISLTEFGHRYVERCEQLLSDLADMENAAQEHSGKPQGTLRINAPVSFATQHLAKALMPFQQQYPDILIDLQLNDRKIDIVQEGFDVALRIGILKDSSLIAKKITPIRLVMCAAPSYLEKYGTPKQACDLKNHHYLHYSYLGVETQNLTNELGLFRKSQCRLMANNGEVLMQAAIDGGGIIVQPTFIVGEALKSGQLKVILPEHEPATLALYAVYAHRQFVSRKVSAFIEFLSEYFGGVPYWD